MKKAKEYFDHFNLEKGGVIRFDMQGRPNKIRGTNPADFPYSFSGGR
jgi:putative alpha-1,2-mannosidase